VKGHQTLEEDDVGWAYVCGLLQAGVLDEGVLWNFYLIAAFYKIHQGFVGEVEVQSVGVVEVVLGDVDLCFINA
jgi:hypothetical protein